MGGPIRDFAAQKGSSVSAHLPEIDPNRRAREGFARVSRAGDSLARRSVSPSGDDAVPRRCAAASARRRSSIPAPPIAAPMWTRGSRVPIVWLLAAGAACAGGASTPPAGARTSMPVPAPDSTSRGGAAAGRDSASRAESDVVIDRREMRRQDSAHAAILELNARIHEKMRVRFSEKTCPPESAYRPDARRRGGAAVAARTDSIRGWIRVCRYGDRRLAALWVSYDDSMDIALVGHQEVLLQLENLDVVVFGHPSRTPGGTWRRLEVRREIVRANGAGFEAVDGILRREATGDFVELPDHHRVRIPSLPEALAEANGMRVYIAGPLEAPLQAGVIRTREIRPAPR